MGLDDFTGDSLSEKEKKRRKELSRNDPPSDNKKWRHYEPSAPDWLSFISGEKIDESTDYIPKLESGAETLEGEDALSVRIENVDSTTVRSDSFTELEDCR